MFSHSENSLNAISRMSPPHAGHWSGNSSPRCFSKLPALRDKSTTTSPSQSALDPVWVAAAVQDGWHPDVFVGHRVV